MPCNHTRAAVRKMSVLFRLPLSDTISIVEAEPSLSSAKDAIEFLNECVIAWREVPRVEDCGEVDDKDFRDR